jgi:hypothetical protein
MYQEIKRRPVGPAPHFSSRNRLTVPKDDSRPDATHAAFERHYRVGELAKIWSLGRETVRLLVKEEQGVIRIRLGRKRAHTIYSVPESVAMRIHTLLLNSR